MIILPSCIFASTARSYTIHLDFSLEEQNEANIVRLPWLSYFTQNPLYKIYIVDVNILFKASTE